MAKLIVPKEPKEVSKTGLSQMRKDYNELAKDYMKIMDNDVLLCPSCNNWMSAKESFYYDKAYMTERYPICKRCLLKMVEQRKTDKDESHETKESVKRVLQMMNRIYDDDFYEQCVKGVGDDVSERNRTSPFSTYITAIQSLPQWKGKTWADSKFGDVGGNTDEDVINPNSYFIKAAQRNFGKEYGLDDLAFLETEFEDWKAKYECNTKAQIEIFKSLSFNQLAQKKARLNGQSTDKLVKEFQELLNTGNITPRQTGLDSMAEAQTFGTLIEKWEQEKPIPEPDEEFRDKNKIGYYFSTYFLGHACKMLGLKNKYSAMYEHEMEKYAVKPPQYDEEEDSERIFERVFGKDGDDQ